LRTSASGEPAAPEVFFSLAAWCVDSETIGAQEATSVTSPSRQKN
jgi:hypothetical protein